MKKICSVEDCEKEHYGLKLCHLHWQRYRRNDRTYLIPPKKRLCGIQGCPRKHACRSYCTKHYARLLRHGDPLKVLPKKNRSYQTQETRLKISKSSMGKKKSLEMRRKLSLAKAGANSLHLWKGGVTKEHLRIRSSSEYRIWRTRVFERDNYTCQECMIRGGKLNADHIKPFSDFPELRLELSNGRTLCEECHRKTPTFGRWRRKVATNDLR